MDIPVITFDVTLAGTLVGTFTNETFANQAVQFIATAAKAGAIFAVPVDAMPSFAVAKRVTQADSIDAAEAAGLTVDYDELARSYEAQQPVPPTTLADPAPQPIVIAPISAPVTAESDQP